MKSKFFKNNSKLSLIVFIVFVIFSFFIYRNFYSKKKYNILIISYCSFRADLLQAYGGEYQQAPHLNDFANSSYVFKNLISNLSWSNVSGFFLFLTKKYVEDMGYKTFGNPWSAGLAQYYDLKPNTVMAPFLQVIQPSSFLDQRRVKYEIGRLEKNITDQKNWPFIHILHSRASHVPYAKNIRNYTSVLDVLSEDEKIYVKSAIENSSNYLNRLPFILMVSSRNENFLKKLYSKLPLDKNEKEKIAENHSHFIGLIDNKYLVNRWKRSTFFEGDIKILKKLYKKLSSEIDQSYRSIFNLFEDKELAKNTVIIFLTDHGESFLENGEDFFHGKGISEELIKLAGFVKFPGQENQVLFNEQFFVGGFKYILEKLMSGEINQNNFESFIEKKSLEYKKIYSTNCDGTKDSLRVENKWKLVRNFLTEESKLYEFQENNKLIDVSEQQSGLLGQLLAEIDMIKGLQDRNTQDIVCGK